MQSRKIFDIIASHDSPWGRPGGLRFSESEEDPKNLIQVILA